MLLGVFKRLALATACCFAAAACRTSSGPAKVADVNPLTGAELTLTQDEAQNLYLKMLSVEMAAGIKVTKDQLHTASGLADCQQDADARSCHLRVRLMDHDLSATQPLPEELATKIWTFIKAGRAELGQEKQVFVDFTCDYLGKKSPPYELEQVSCRAGLPRGLGEAVLVEKTAEELVEALRGTQAFGDKVVTLNGSVACKWLKPLGRTPCSARTIQAGILQDKVTEVGPGAAAEIARALRQALADQLNVEVKEKTGKVVELPGEIAASLTCVVDNTKYESDGKRLHLCRTKYLGSKS